MVALRAFVAVTAAAVFLLLAAPPMLENPPVVYTGAHFEQTGALVGPVIIRVDAGSPAARAGLRTDDRVACLSRRDVVLLLSYEGSASPYAPGISIQLCAFRNGAWQAFQITPTEMRPAGYLYGSLWFSILRLAVYGAFLLVGILLVMARPSPLTWVFFAYCLGSVPGFAANVNDTGFSPVWYAITISVLNVLTWCAPTLMLMFALLVPDDRITGGWRLPAFRLACAFTLGIAAFMIFRNTRPDLHFSPAIQVGITDAATVAIVLVLFVRLMLVHGEERARLAWASLAIFLGIVINDARTEFTSGPFALMGSLAGVLTIVMPLTLMYAILKQHLIDVRFIISRTVVYAAITTLVVGVIGVVDWATSAYLTQARAAMAIDAFVTIALGFALHRTYRWLERVVDFLLFRKKHEAQAYLHRLGRTLLRAKREETIDYALVRDPYEMLDLTLAALFRTNGAAYSLSSSAGWNDANPPAFDADHDLVRFLLTERKPFFVAELRSRTSTHLTEPAAAPAVAIPIFQGDDLSAFALYGLHRDGTKLDPDEVEALEKLCEVGAQAYTRVENLRYRALLQRPEPA
jgi:hypothetical protein